MKEQEELFGMKVGGGRGAGGMGGASYMYVVHVASSSGIDFRLVTHLTEIAQAQFIEQEIERHLRIKDLQVRGELPRRPSA